MTQVVLSAFSTGFTVGQDTNTTSLLSIKDAAVLSPQSKSAARKLCRSHINKESHAACCFHDTSNSGVERGLQGGAHRELGNGGLVPRQREIQEPRQTCYLPPLGEGQLLVGYAVTMG